MNDNVLGNASFEKDRHEAVTKKANLAHCKTEILNYLQMNVLGLFCKVKCKSKTVRRMMSSDVDNKCAWTSMHDRWSNHNPQYRNDLDRNSIEIILYSVPLETLVLNYSDSTFHTVYNDTDEIDLSHQMVDMCKSSNDVPTHENRTDHYGMSDYEDCKSVGKCNLTSKIMALSIATTTLTFKMTLTI